MLCPKCQKNPSDVFVEVQLRAGDERAGSSTSVSLALCGTCGHELLASALTLVQIAAKPAEPAPLAP